MKNLITLFVSLFIAVNVFAQPLSIQNFLKKYASQEDFTSIEVSENLFKLVASIEGNEEIDQLDDIIGKLRGVHVLVFEKEGANEQATALFNEAMAAFNSNSYNELLSLKGKGENVKLLVKSQNDAVIDDLILIVNDGDEFALISITGQIDISNLSKLGKSIHIDGMEHLEKLEPSK